MLSSAGPHSASLYADHAAPLVAFLAVGIEPAPSGVLLECRAVLAFVATTVARHDILFFSYAGFAAIVADRLATLGAIAEMPRVSAVSANGAFELDVFTFGRVEGHGRGIGRLGAGGELLGHRAFWLLAFGSVGVGL